MSYIRRRTLPSGTIRYYPIITRGGERIHLGGYNRRRDALARLQKVEMELAAGTFHRPTARFGEFSERWLEAKQADVKPSSLVAYSIRLRHLSPLNNLDLPKITDERIEALKAKLVSDLAPVTVNGVLQVLSSILNRAVAWGYIEGNPMKRVSRVKVPHREMQYLTPEEIQCLLSASENYYPLFLTAVMTGLRKSELLRLTRADVDTNRGLLIVRGETKSKQSRRAVELTPTNLEVLSTMPEGKLFPFSERQVGLALKRVLARAGLKDIRFHDLRHTYAALMISLGGNIKFIQHQLGHSTISMTLDTYGHLIPQAGRGANKLDSLVFDPSVIPFPRQTGGRRAAEQTEQT